MNTEKLLNHYPVLLPDFENHKILIKTAGFWTGAKLFFDGEPVPRAGKKGQYVLQDQEDKEVRLRIRFENIFNPVPKVMSDGKYIYLTEPIKWVQWVWCGFPLIYILIHILLGGILGIIGFLINSQIFGVQIKKPYKYLFSGVISTGIFIIFLLLSDLFNLPTRGFHLRTPFEFINKEGNYSIMAPNSLEELNETINTNPGKIEVHYFSTEKGDITYLVGYLEYFPEYYQTSDLLMRLDTGPERILKIVNGELISETRISLNSNPGREYTFINQNESGEVKIVRLRAFVVNNRMYQMIASFEKTEENNQKVDDFFRSFHLLEK